MATDSAMDTALDPYEVDPVLDLDRPWTEAEYLKLDTNRLVEFVDGTIEVLAWPTLHHQLILGFLLNQLFTFSKVRSLGIVLMAPFPIRTVKGRYREPDVFFVRKKPGFEIRSEDRCFDHADLVMEVVSDDDRRRDLHTKRREYAQAGIPEYWIVDPREEAITVLALRKESGPYDVHGIFRRGQRATSACLPGFEVDVAEVFAQKP